MADLTVLMAVHNGAAHLRQAIDSILAQTFPHFEFVIVDDGSTDDSNAICRTYSDPRIRLVHLAQNRGLSEALNTGLADTRTALVARLDADDVAEPQRLERQRDVMRARPEVALLGSQALATTSAGVETGTVRRPLEPASILWASLFDNPFIHPTVMFRAAVVRDELGGFRKEFDPFSQDYDLWCRVMARHAVINIPDRLIRYRVHESSIMGQLGQSGAEQGYDARFGAIARTLIVQHVRRIFSSDQLADDEAALLPGLILGVPANDLEAFLAVFEKLLALFRQQHPGSSTPDFALTLARQFDGLAMRIHPSSRRTAARVYSHAVRRHPDIRGYISWPRTLALVLLGKQGRDRVGAWSRRYTAGVD